MQAHFVQDGGVIDYTPAEFVPAGSVVVVNDLVGIAILDIPAGGLGSLKVVGVFAIAKVTGELTIGTKVYWDADADPVDGEAGSGALTTTASGNSYVGKVIADAAADDPTALVRLDDSVSISAVVPQQPAITSLTDNSGGTAGDTIAAIGATYDQAEVADAVASLAAGQESILTVLRDAGIIATS